MVAVVCYHWRMIHNYSRYTRGCRCAECTNANREHNNEYNRTHPEYRAKRKVYMRAYYAANKGGPDGLRARHNERARATRAGERGAEAQRRARDTAIRQQLAHAARARKRIDKIKAAPCMDCGGVFPPECMDFDHRPGEGKFMSVGRMYMMNPTRLAAEIAKCDLVCANCHRVRTRARGQGGWRAGY